ncbi:protein SCO1-like isoform X1 [Leptotrombidium deliense]|uniref:Protein SCO1-like isoform X1 n=1 Tax=Leptotrombidium deliense TaxID=299467 RepID=A0A443S9C6_9ACAR|nr:protein SCO1-like isoform X1 [Leptotrombidium deliense]
MAKSGIGGQFELVDGNSKKVSSQELLGKWLLIYFGFTHCPDICPDEMQKMVDTVNLLEKDGIDVIPVFISVDPDRDTPQVVKKYASEFSSKIIALTGNKEQVQQAAKAFRVYHSLGPKDKFEDYIVDHTIITYLINPKGNFVDYYGNRKNAQQMRNSILSHMKNYEILEKKSWLDAMFK